MTQSSINFKIKNRDAVSHCGMCVETPGCAFCESSLECMDYSGDSHDCKTWINASASCPSEYFQISKNLKYFYFFQG